ncbi:hypothetical protein PRIPAC_87702 [Pristionchus pacificus]|uniref:Nuclear receptor n=1 Tax=Pristionchus pacificus TaxID=54126 RepID=A0A2A6B822_PRIPA|nr:hypothetical protein PRIPAC_87702 [Pristionchus pacificus]|eukprot:PDM62015.1 nuclear receptor [Pristionchus pacificus]
MWSLQCAHMEWGRLPDGSTAGPQLVLLQTAPSRPSTMTMPPLPPPLVHHGMPSTSSSGEQSTAASAPTTSPSSKKPACAVCGDTALGKHYGVLACNGCKGFFRRTVWKKRTYKCRGDGQCPVNTEQRNACRACRYSQCIRVGMNPRAVQGDLNECRRNGVICTLPKGAQGRVEKEDDEPPSEGCMDEDDGESLPDVKPPTTSTTSTQTKAIEEDPSALDTEIDELVKRFKRVCDRWEEPTVVEEDALPSQDPITQTVRVEFAVIYKHPELVCARSKLDSSAARIADLDDILGDYRRAFVLFCDLLHATPEIMEMDENDQLMLAKKSFGSFYWMMTAIWSQTSHKPGVCYANGSYFPTEKEHQRFPDAKDCASRCVFHLNEPIRALVLTDAEQAVAAYLACFIDGVPKLSADGCKKYSAMRDKLIRYLYELCGKTMVSRGMRGELAVAGRVSRIISIYPSITDLCMRASDNMEVCEVLQTVKFDSWMTKVSCDRTL